MTTDLELLGFVGALHSHAGNHEEVWFLETVLNVDEVVGGSLALTMRLLIQNEGGLTCCFQPTTKQENAVSADWHRAHIAHLLWQFYCERRPLRLEGHQVNHFNR